MYLSNLVNYSHEFPDTPAITDAQGQHRLRNLREPPHGDQSLQLGHNAVRKPYIIYM